jgi:hypothetical protein
MALDCAQVRLVADILTMPPLRAVKEVADRFRIGQCDMAFIELCRQKGSFAYARAADESTAD